MMTKVTLRNLAAHKLRLVLTAISVVLGVSFVAGTLIFTDTMNRRFDELFDRFGENVAVQVQPRQVVGQGDDETESGSARPIPASVLEAVRKVEGVRDPEGQVSGYAALVGRDGKLIGGQGPPQLGVNWTPGGDYALSSGRAPSGPDEVVIDDGTAKDNGFKVGDQVQVVLKGHPPQRPRIVGLIDAGHLLGATVVGYDTPSAQRLMLRPGTFSSITMASSGVGETELRDRVARVLPSGYEALTGTEIRAQNESDVAGFLGFFRTFLLVFALIAIFVGAFIIFNTFSMLVAQRTRELALLRAIGAARRQVTRAVIAEAVAVGAIGATFGLAGGAGLALLLKGLVGVDTGGLTFGPTPVIWSYVVGIGVTVISAYFPARRAAKIPPVAAMRDDVALPQRSMRIRIAVGGVLTVAGAVLMALGLAGVELGGHVMIPVGVGAFSVFLGVALLAPVASGPVVRTLGAAYPRLFGAPGRMAQRNAMRNPRRTAATAAALMIGLALVTMVNVLGSSMRASVDAAVDTQLGADYIVGSQGNAGIDDTALQKVRAVPGVDQALPVYYAQASFNGDDDGYTAADQGTLRAGVRMKITSGTDQLGTDGLMVSDDRAKSENWRVGTAVRIQFPNGDVGQARIVGTYAPNEFTGSQVLALPLHRAHNDDPPSGLVVNTASVDEATTQALDRALAGYPALEVQNQAQVKEDAAKEIDTFVGFLSILLAMSIIIAAVGVVNTLALSVVERTREIGLLRAVGLSRRQLRRMIRLESVVIAVFGALLGITVGVIFGWAVQHALADDGLNLLRIPVATLVVYVAVAGVVGILAALWPAWRAGRMDVLKAIATE